MNKYKALFLEESREHLAELSRLLVAVEASADPAGLIAEVFRHAHSIKGMAASMGYGEVSALSHGMEDVVGRFRDAGGEVPKHIIDSLLGGVDALLAQVEAIANGKTPLAHAELLTAFAAAAQGEPIKPAPDAVAQGDSVDHPGDPRCESPLQGMIVRVRIGTASPSPAARAFLVHRRLAAIGTIVEASPTLEKIKAKELTSNEMRFLVTGATEEEIAQALAVVSDLEAITCAPAEEHKSPKVTVESAEPAKGANTVRVRIDVLDALIDSVGELFIARERLVALLGQTTRPDVRAALDVLSARVREIHEQVMAVRMMPLRSLTDRYPRLVRDLARALGKDAELVVDGSDLELDRGILDHLDAVFVHVLRNAVDHGIESVSERRESGKAARGKIEIRAARDRDMVSIVIEDDGRGLDPERLRALALARGLITEDESERFSARDSYFLVCLPGFSTKSEVSDVSGRGVGMDAVRGRIEGLGGTLDIESEVGKYTRFFVRLPLSLAIIPVLLVRAASTVFAIPVAKVASIRECGDDLIHQPGGVSYLSFRHALVPVLELAELVRLPRVEREAGVVVIVEDGRELCGLGVDRVVGYYEAVVKPLGDPLDRLEWFSGAAVLGDGKPILVLDLAYALRQRAQVAEGVTATSFWAKA